jgi:hypothetical protein
MGAARELEGHGLDVTVADARFAKPLDTELLDSLVADHDLLVTIEDGVLMGGFGSAVGESLLDRGMAGDVHMLRLGLPDRYVTHGKPALLREEVGLTADAVAGRVAEAVGWHRRLFTLSRDLLSVATNPIPVKTAMKLLGRDTGELRLPLCPLDPAGEGRIASTLRSYGLLK